MVPVAFRRRQGEYLFVLHDRVQLHVIRIREIILFYEE